MQRAVRRLMPGLGTRAQDTPELEDEDNEFTNLLGAKCKEDDVREVAEDRGVQPVHEFRGAEDGDAPGRLLPKGATVQFHSLSTTEGATTNGLYGRIIKVYHKAPDKARVYKVMIVMKNDPIKPVKVRETNIWKLPDIS